MAEVPFIPILPLLEGRAGRLREMRFWSKVDMRGPDECWDWQASRTTSGYGRFKLLPRTIVHSNRFALIATKQEEPKGLLVLHSCDRPECCNPAHLRFGTTADNHSDKIERGRHRTGDQSGFNNGAVKIRPEQLQLIVDRLRMGWPNTRIAADLPVTHSLVSRIRLGISWRDQAEALGWSPVERAA
jgi:hypothetical protein